MVTLDTQKEFEDRFVKGATVIKGSGIDYVAAGIFGSFARGEHSVTSDIDFVLYLDKEPDKLVYYRLKDDLDSIKCDVSLISVDHYYAPANLFQERVKRDVIIWECTL